jgi:ribulose-5-phosphate 4-epimerase/fuculose-1-phosphate aldolase
MNKKEQGLRVELIEIAKRALSDGLIWGSAGNFSVRDPQTGNILITPSGVEYTKMLPEDIVTLGLDGEKLEGKLQPSFEAPVHCAVYRARPDIDAVVHTEPQYVNAFGTARVEMPIVSHILGKIKKSIQIGPWTASGNEAFAAETVALLGDQYAIIWPNHGLLVVGPSIYEAYMLSWYIESNAKVFLLAKMLGEPQPPPSDYFSSPEE